MNKVKVFAPATMANLAVGFDQLGLAINEIGDYVTVSKNNFNKITIECNVNDIPLEVEKNTAGMALKAFCERINYKEGLHIKIEKGIPVGSGLGGSASSAVGAVVAANKLLNNPLGKRELLECALVGESLSGAGHYDNIAPCLYGGITLISGKDIIELNNNVKDLKIVIIHPKITINTKESRKLLPNEIQLSDHIKQSGYMSMFLLSLEQGNYDNLLKYCNDIIVEPKRKNLIEGFDDFKKYCNSENTPFSISGSGPTLFTLCNSKNVDNIKSNLDKIAKKQNYDYWIREVTINTKGAK